MRAYRTPSKRSEVRLRVDRDSKLTVWRYRIELIMRTQTFSTETTQLPRRVLRPRVPVTHPVFRTPPPPPLDDAFPGARIGGSVLTCLARDVPFSFGKRDENESSRKGKTWFRDFRRGAARRCGAYDFSGGCSGRRVFPDNIATTAGNRTSTRSTARTRLTCTTRRPDGRRRRIDSGVGFNCCDCHSKN